MAWERWQALPEEDKERYRRQARQYAERGRKAVVQFSRRGRRRRAVAPTVGAAELAAGPDGAARRRPPADAGRPTVCATAALLRMLVPAVAGRRRGCARADGGRQSRTLARADGAAGWCLAVAATGGVLAAFMEPAPAREVFGDPRGWVAGVFAPKGRAVPAGDGEFTVSGRWPFASGCAHADWLMGGCLVQEGDDVRRTDSGAPDVRLALMPAAQTASVDTWTVAGLRGTGSNDFEVAGVTVPRGAIGLAGLRHARASRARSTPSPLLACWRWPSAPSGWVSRVARSTTWSSSPAARSRPWPPSRWPTSPTPRCAWPAPSRPTRRPRLRGHGDREAWEQAVDRHDVDLERRAGLRLAASHAMHTAAGVVDEMYSLGGGSSVYETSPLQRRHRDIHVATQHMLVNPSTWEFAGRVLLGAPVRAEQF